MKGVPIRIEVGLRDMEKQNLTLARRDTSEKIIDLDDNPDIEYKISLSSKTNIYDVNIINIKSEVKKWLSKKVNIYAIYNHEYYNEQEDFQFKVGIGVKL